jgi:hypothetical protein
MNRTRRTKTPHPHHMTPTTRDTLAAAASDLHSYAAAVADAFSIGWPYALAAIVCGWLYTRAL